MSWLRQKVVTENIAGLNLAAPVTPGATVSVMGSVDVVADPCVSNTNNTDQDVVYVLPSLDVIHLFLGAPQLSVLEGGSGTLSGISLPR